MEPLLFHAPAGAAAYPQYQVWQTAALPDLLEVRLYLGADDFRHVASRRVTQEALDLCDLLNSTLALAA